MSMKNLEVAKISKPATKDTQQTVKYVSMKVVSSKKDVAINIIGKIIARIKNRSMKKLNP